MLKTQKWGPVPKCSWGPGGIGAFGGPVEVGVHEGVEDTARNPVLVVRWVVFGIAFGR